MVSAASRRALEAFCSPSAAITYGNKKGKKLVFLQEIIQLSVFYPQRLTLALASLAASASAAIALWSCTGSRTSFLKLK